MAMRPDGPFAGAGGWFGMNASIGRQHLSLPALLLTDGEYQYNKGWNWLAVAATAAGCFFAWTGLVVPVLHALCDYSWFVGLGTSAIWYYVLMKARPVRRSQALSQPSVRSGRFEKMQADRHRITSMNMLDKSLESARKAVRGYNSEEDGNELRPLRALLSALDAGQKYIAANSERDPRCAERLARGLDKLLDSLPELRKLPGGKGALPHLHKGKQATEHLQRIRDHLSAIARGLEEVERKRIQSWMKSQPALNDLHEAVSAKLPNDAYVLLFRKTGEGQVEIVTQLSRDGRVFTRFRPAELRDRTRLYRQFHAAAPIDGAAVVAGDELLIVIGEVPEAEEGQERLKAVLAVSSSAVSKPTRDFLDSHPVLKELNTLSNRRKIPKQAYVLLFQEQTAAAAVDWATDAPAESATDTEQELPPEPPAEPAAETEEELPSDAFAEPSLDTIEEPPPEPPAEPAAETGEELPSEPLTEPYTDTSEAPPEPVAEPDSETAAGETAIGASEGSALDLVVRTSRDGRVITRFRAGEFSDKRKLFDSFRDKPPIVGAAVIEDTKLLHALGRLPHPKAGQSQVQALLQVSRKALDMPALDFIAANEVLNGLHKLAQEPRSGQDSDVVLFTAGEAGKLVPLTSGRDKRRPSATVPLSDFRSARAVHDTYSGQEDIVGASVVAPEQASSRKPARPAGGGERREAAGKGGHRAGPPKARPIVIAAFGRTPLKEGLLATPEILVRLGLNISLG